MLLVGVRVVEKDQVDIDGNPIPTQDFTSVNPRIAIISKPTPTDVIKLMGGKAFRAPTVYEYDYTDGGISQVASSANPNKLVPETVYSGELEYTHRFNRDWSLLGSIYETYAQDIIQSVPVPQSLIDAHNANPMFSPWANGVEYYANSTVPINITGVDFELRKEWRAGTMFMATYGYLQARYTNDRNGMEPNTHTPNAPTQYASIRGVTPLVPNLVNGAIRVTLEDERRLNDSTDVNSKRAIIADVVLSGRIARYGLKYAFGVYNLFNWQYAEPVNGYTTPAMPQAGRSLMFNLLYTQAVGSQSKSSQSTAQ